ncbi:MAG TPA: hypothetical protein VMV44_09345 [Rectinemataceae bacterium]|nr:hypothetical protein [Rectinemataceae bacterium]
MRVALIHFHLKKGGVGSVMARQVASLAAAGLDVRTAFIVGTPPEGETAAPCYIASGLDYDASGGRRPDESSAAKLADSMEEAIGRAFPEGCDLLHVHNPLIHKNAALLGALRILRERGHALLVQVHDLAEDFRPEVYDALSPYPEACDYAAINGRDRDRLVAAGLEPERVHFLPNPVAFHEGFEPRRGYALESAKGRRRAIYPVRAIGRKNLGEALLLSLFLPEGAELAVTLPPTSPGDHAAYEAWKDLALSQGLRLRFEVGLGASLAELYETSFCAVTSSVKEGFGYSYLDPLVRGLPVVGRAIAHIVGDFGKKGLRFDSLYDGISIPRSALPAPILRETAAARIATIGKAYAPAFGRDRDRLDAALEGLRGRFDGEFLDFGAIDPELQAALVSRLASEPGFAAEIAGLNPFLETLFLSAPGSEAATRRRDAVLEGYSEKEYGKLLFEAYRSAVAGGARGRIDKARFLESYLEPSSFFLCAS